MPDGSIILMGGMGNGGSLNNDTWRSMDKGAIWTQMNESSGWSARYGTSSIAMPDSSIVLIGGSIGFGSNKKDVWRSTDNGTTWDEVNASVGWSARYQHSIVTLPDGSIVLMGGSSDSGYKNDVWRSTDNGTTWEEVNASAGWLGREGHRCVAMPDGSIVLTGGYSGSRENDVWRSTDNGATWKEANVSAGWSGRAGHGIVTIPDGSIVLMGGCDNTECARNDVWRMNPVGSSAQNPTHVYTTPGTYQVTLQVYNAIGFNSTRKTGYITVTNVSKIGVFRNSTHLFYLDQNGNGVWNGVLVDRANNFGISGDIPISGDWNTDRKTEIGVFRPSTHLFYLDYNGNGVWNGAAVDRQYNFGLTGDMPVSGDWNTDGKYEIGVFRNSTHLFYLDYNGNGAWNGASVDKQYNFGITGDIPLTGDWNLDGRTEIGVFRNSTHLFYLDYNGNGVWNGAVTDKSYNFGISGDIPVTGDWNADGRTEIGVFRPSTHLFYLDYNGNGVWNGVVTDRSYNFGITGDIPISGKW
jgi:PKD repeat protein